MKKIAFFIIMFIYAIQINALKIGDNLSFSVKYTFLGGHTTCSVDSISIIDSTKVYCINYHTKVSSVIDVKALLYLDKNNLIPVKILTENKVFNKKSHGKALFYRKEKLARFYEWKNGNVDSIEFTRKEEIQDILTLPFFLMTIAKDSINNKRLGLLQGEFTLHIVGYDTLKMKINEKTQFIPAIHLKSDPPIMDAYISNDSFQLPLIVNTKQKIGRMQLKLKSHNLN